MLIKGEKYACEACVRGHRVSNCQHSDRPLQHINKKGRPVSQCAHCRTLRKSRSAHVRCDCGGEKPHAKNACTHDGDSHADNCGCIHGTRCTCAVKKEHLDTVPESDSDGASAGSSNGIGTEKRRPRALTAQSDNGGLTICTNGHHKAIHKHNTMAHKCGLPYVIPRANTIHGPASLANRSVDNLPHVSTIEALHSESHIKDSMVSAQQEQRLIKSEHGSPVQLASSTVDQLKGQLSPLDLSSIPGDYNFLQSYGDMSATFPDPEAPIFSAGLSAQSVDWSLYDLDFSASPDNFAASSYSQAPSFNGYDYSSLDQPALTTTSTSGEISEVEDFVQSNGNNQRALSYQKYGSDFDASDFSGEAVGNDSYQLSSASSYINMSQAPSMTNLGAADMEAFLKDVAASTNGYSGGSSGFQNFNFEEEKGLSSASFDDGPAFIAIPADDDDVTDWSNSFATSNPKVALGTTGNDYQTESVWRQ